MATFLVSNLNDSGSGSLRAAITAANADSSGTPTVIAFSVNGTITLAGDLPAITQNVTIDATSAPAYATGGPPVVEINANGHAGVVFAAGSDGSHLLGVAVDNANGNGVTLNAGSITLNDNYIGLNLAGQAAGNSGDGVYVSASSSNNLIGLNPTSALGTAAAAGIVTNVISGNGGNGISFHGSSGNTVVANRIGTDPTGSFAIANGGNGIWVTARSGGNTIGGSAYVNSTTGLANDPTGAKGTVTPTFIVPPLGNLVSGNGQTGILVDGNSQQNVLSGNFVGTTANGDAAIGNAGNGVWINGADNNSLIGTPLLNPPGSADPGSYNQTPFTYYNVISGNGGNGLEVTSSNNVTVQANFLGAGANNAGVVANRLNGILVDGSSQNTQVGGVIPLGNVVSGNDLNGIEVTGTVSGFETFNTFGGGLAFGPAAPNGNDGLLITSTGGDNIVRTNVFSGNDNNGIEIAGNASGVMVDPNIVGLTTNGQALLPNGNDGLLITDTAHGNSIGGHVDASVIPNQTFSGNDGYGVAILGQAYDNSVFNNYIGTNVLGTVALGNGMGGVFVGDQANNNTIGGSSSNPSQPTANLISGNTGNGVTLTTSTNNNQIVDNSIGVDRFGLPLPNSGSAVAVDGPLTPPAFFVSQGVLNLVLTPDGNNLPAPVAGAFNLEEITAPIGTNYSLPPGYQGVALVSQGVNQTITLLSGAYGVVGGGSGDSILGGSGNVSIGGAISDTLVGGAGVQFIDGSAGNQSITGGSAGSETIWGGGSDTINGGGANVTIGGGQFDVVIGGTGVEFIDASAGNQAIAGGSAGNETIWGGAGDRIRGGGAANETIGGVQSDTIAGGTGTEFIDASVGNQAVAGGSAGNETIWGGAGDLISGGGAANETIGGVPNDIIVGGTGTEFIDASGGNQAIIGGSAGNETIWGGAGDTINGGGAATKTIGGVQNDTIMGGSGVEFIDGAAGNQVITAGSGNETIWGGAGDAIGGGSGQALIGLGAGPELFVDGSSVYTDTVSGFVQSAGDRIHLTTDTVSDALAHSTQVNGGQSTLISFSDGSSILLQGVSHIDPSFFT